MKYYGLFGTNIPRSIVPIDWSTLEDGEQIINSIGDRVLRYIEEDKSYVLVTLDPREYLSESQLYQSWKKR